MNTRDSRLRGNNFTDELRQRLSIVDIVGRVVPLTKKGQNYWGCCPFHNEKTPSFSVNEEKGFYHCFGCGEHGDIIGFTMKHGNMDFKNAIAELAQIAGVKMPEYKPKSAEQIQREENYFSIYESAAKIYQEKLFSPEGSAALAYVRKRGFTDEIIKKYRLGYAPKNNFLTAKFSNVNFNILESTGLVKMGNYGPRDFFFDRLMFPIMNPSGQVIAFSGRSLDGSEPKYINTSDTELFHKRHTIFGLNFARDAIYRANRSIVVEGQIDAIQMQCNGFNETVAPLGTALTEDHVALLCKSNRNITFCFDGDGAGQKAAGRALDIVAPFIRDNSEIKFAFMPKGSDPDEILKQPSGAEHMKNIIDSALGTIDFLWDFVNKNFNTATPNGKTQGEKWIAKWLEKITDTRLREMLKVEIDNLVWQNWKKIKNKKETDIAAARAIELPQIDDITNKTLAAIIETYPELAERYGDFLTTLNMNLGIRNQESGIKSSIQDAEKFIVSLKLKKYLEKLNADKKELTTKLLSGDDSIKPALTAINTEIEKQSERLKKIMDI